MTPASPPPPCRTRRRIPAGALVGSLVCVLVAAPGGAAVAQGPNSWDTNPRAPIGAARIQAIVDHHHTVAGDELDRAAIDRLLAGQTVVSGLEEFVSAVRFALRACIRPRDPGGIF